MKVQGRMGLENQAAQTRWSDTVCKRRSLLYVAKGRTRGKQPSYAERLLQRQAEQEG